MTLMTLPLLCTDYQYLREFLNSRIGHDLGEGKEYLVQSRLGAVAESKGIPGLAVLFDRLRKSRDAALETAVVEAMVTCETSFFRTPSLFASLKRTVIPDLLRARAATRRLNVWCAGCSTGQEPYSVALTLYDEFPELRRWDVSILATDISEFALRRGRSASYSETDVRRGLDASTLKTHFHPLHHRWVVNAEIRRLVTFRALNLAEPLPFDDEFDIVFLRNVLIYFCPQQKRSVLRGLRNAIRDDGYLFLGESETILGLSEQFTFPPGGQEFYRPAPR